LCLGPTWAREQSVQRKHPFPACGPQRCLLRHQHFDMGLPIREAVVMPRRQRLSYLLNLPHKGVEPLLLWGQHGAGLAEHDLEGVVMSGHGTNRDAKARLSMIAWASTVTTDSQEPRPRLRTKVDL